jgi:hypothetical protein
MKLTSNLILLIFILSSCITPPMRRGTRTTRASKRGYRSKKKMMFNPIRKKVALLPLFNESPFGGTDLAFNATEDFRRELIRTRDFLVDPSASNMFGTSKEIYSQGGVKLKQLARKAKLSGVNLVIFGRITQARLRQKTDEIGVIRKTKSMAQTEIELRIFDVHAAKEILNERSRANIKDSDFKFYMSNKESKLAERQELLRYSMRVAVRRIIPKLIAIGEKLDWTGRVAKIIGTKIYVNAGRDSGINIGDILKIVTEGQEIFDPESGAMIGISKGEVKGTLEVVDYFGADGAVTVLHSGGQVTEGDFIQLY